MWLPLRNNGGDCPFVTRVILQIMLTFVTFCSMPLILSAAEVFNSYSLALQEILQPQKFVDCNSSSRWWVKSVARCEVIACLFVVSFSQLILLNSTLADQYARLTARTTRISWYQNVRPLWVVLLQEVMEVTLETTVTLKQWQMICTWLQSDHQQTHCGTLFYLLSGFIINPLGTLQICWRISQSILSTASQRRCTGREVPLACDNNNSHQYQHGNSHFYRPDALSATPLRVSKHWRSARADYSR